jgi:hypothetical protein
LVTALLPNLTTCSPVAFIDKHQIVALKALYCYSLFAFLFTKLVYVDNFDRLTGKKTSTVRIKQLGC